MSTRAHNLTTDNALIYLPAKILWKLAFSPAIKCNPTIQESLIEDGWKIEHPAKIFVSPGNYPKIDGRHRLGFLNSVNKLDMIIPTMMILD